MAEMASHIHGCLCRHGKGPLRQWTRFGWRSNPTTMNSPLHSLGPRCGRWRLVCCQCFWGPLGSIWWWRHSLLVCGERWCKEEKYPYPQTGRQLSYLSICPGKRSCKPRSILQHHSLPTLIEFKYLKWEKVRLYVLLTERINQFKLLFSKFLCNFKSQRQTRFWMRNLHWIWVTISGGN